MLTFMDNSLLDLSDFKCRIDNFKIKGSDFSLAENLLNKQIFKSLTYLSITNSFLRNIQNDLFQSFYALRMVEFELLNFFEFVKLNAKNDWLKYLNSNVTVDLSDANDIEKNMGYSLELLWTDLGKQPHNQSDWFKKVTINPKMSMCLIVNK